MNIGILNEIYNYIKEIYPEFVLQKDWKKKCNVALNNKLNQINRFFKQIIYNYENKDNQLNKYKLTRMDSFKFIDLDKYQNGPKLFYLLDEQLDRENEQLNEEDGE